MTELNSAMQVVSKGYANQVELLIETHFNRKFGRYITSKDIPLIHRTIRSLGSGRRVEYYTYNEVEFLRLEELNPTVRTEDGAVTLEFKWSISVH